MDHVGIEVHKRESQVCILTPEGELTEVRSLRATRIEARRGKAVATVALARKLAGILFAMLRDGTPFDPGKQASVVAARAARLRGERPGAPHRGRPRQVLRRQRARTFFSVIGLLPACP